jgi:hypothetical protein
VLNGTWSLPVLGTSFMVGPSNFTLKRHVAFMYDSNTAKFSSSLELSGTLDVSCCASSSSPVAAAALLAGPPGSSSSLAVAVTGQVTLSTATYPGPGLSGAYDWAGSLVLTPNPWSHFGLLNNATGSSSSSGGRRLQVLGDALSHDASPLQQPPETSSTLADGVRSSDCSTRQTKAVPAVPVSEPNSSNGHDRQQQADLSTEPAGSAAMSLSQASIGPFSGSSSSSSSHGTAAACKDRLQPLYRGLLQSSAGGSSITTPVSGLVTVQETGSAAPPSLQDDEKRGDGLTFLDADGSVLLIGAAGVPPSSIPTWKQVTNTTGTKKGIPTWVWWAVVGGAVLLAMAVGVACLMALASRRRQQRDTSNHHGAPPWAAQQQLQEGTLRGARSGASLAEPPKQQQKTSGSRHNGRSTGNSHHSIAAHRPQRAERPSPRSRYRPNTAPEEELHDPWQGRGATDLQLPGSGGGDGEGYEMYETPATSQRRGNGTSSHGPTASGGRREVHGRRSVDATIPASATLSEHWVQEVGVATPTGHSRGRGQGRGPRR